MKILFTGKPNKGSWQIRAVQMAAEFGECIPYATEKQCRAADFIVAIKRVPQEVLNAIRASGTPWAWDTVDCYPQPACSGWSREWSIEWMREQVRSMQPTVVCFATQRMRQDVGFGGAVIYHHHRPGIATNPIREKIRVIGYEGASQYLGHWEKRLEQSARHIGAEFTMKPSALADCDVVVAFRGGAADCYATRHWKSNVKLANAHASGTPFIGQLDDGYRETMTGAEHWVDEPKDIDLALEWLSSQRERLRVSQVFRGASISVQDCQKSWQEVAGMHI